MYIFSRLTVISILSACVQCNIAYAEGQVKIDGLSEILDVIADFESKKDPKCLATASRLEDFMYGTPLTESARIKKIELQKNMVLDIWGKATIDAKARGKESIYSEDIEKTIHEYLTIQKHPSGDVAFIGVDKEIVNLKFDDLRQYSSVAYALRAILGVQQDIKNQVPEQYLPLEKSAIDSLKYLVDVITLAALQLADQDSRLADQFTIDEIQLERSWEKLVSADLSTARMQEVGISNDMRDVDLSTIQGIIAQKIKSYEGYNSISMPVFMRNIQVYFARHRWPADPNESKKLKIVFNEALIAFSKELYLGSQSIGIERKHNLIRLEDVSNYVHILLPHKINEYEDAIFFPKLSPSQQVVIEAYDMDAFRDSGLHWQYLGSAIEDSKSEIKLEPDPFAAEMIVENIAQFGVLLLREAGAIAQQRKAESLNEQHIHEAFAALNQLIKLSNSTETNRNALPTIVSAEAADGLKDGSYFFENVTEQSGINFRHGSADWLNRLIRSYTVRNKEVAVLAVPPAFGGAGIAAEDINDDGLIDILLLGGRGNKLFQNMGEGKFRDITAESGISWTRKQDDLPGEPRQPIIADFDNDGKQDIFITFVNDDHRMYRNLGTGKFLDVTAQTALGGSGLVAGPATVADFDNDGLLDIYIGYFGLYTDGIKPTLARRNFNGLPNQLFKNMGDFKFQNISFTSGVDNTGWTQALTHTDLNRDGWQDLIVGNDFGINAYYQNQGDGTFKNIASALGVDKPSYTMNIGIADINDDLLPDVYISNIVTMDKDQKYVLPGDSTPMKLDAHKMAKMRIVEANDLFLSEARDGKLHAYHSAAKMMGRGSSTTGWAWGASYFDVDNDGDDDLYVVNGMNDFALYSTENPYYTDSTNTARDVLLPQSNKENNVFFINDNGRFHNVSERSGANLLGNSRSVAYLDIDSDGDLDMVLNNYHSDAVVYRNNAEQLKNNWIKLKLLGNPEVGSNRDAIGARIIATTDTGKRVWREIRCGEAYLTVHTKEQHIGLGKSQVANVTIEWPNGEKVDFKNLKSGISYTIDQRGNSIRPSK
jgi:hypothetical protein